MDINQEAGLLFSFTTAREASNARGRIAVDLEVDVIVRRIAAATGRTPVEVEMIVRRHTTSHGWKFRPNRVARLAAALSA